MRAPSRDGTPLEESAPIVHLDMNLSSSFDDLTPEQPDESLRPVWLPMAAGNQDVMRAFYVDLLRMTEVAPPKHAAEAAGLWLTNGFRTLYLGTEPAFAHILENPPRFRSQQLDDTYAGLIAAGHVAHLDESLAYARCVTVTDPAGNKLAFVGA
jgi:hypothetical protein